MAHLLSRLLAFGLASSVVLTQTIEIAAPATVPAAASNPVGRKYLGLMVETTSWPPYANPGFSVELIENLADRIGVSIVIRVGGTSGDYAIYIASQTTAIHRDDPTDFSLTANITLGPPFLDAFSKVLDATYVLELPLARDTVQQMVDFAKAAVSPLDSTS